MDSVRFCFWLSIRFPWSLHPWIQSRSTWSVKHRHTLSKRQPLCPRVLSAPCFLWLHLYNGPKKLVKCNKRLTNIVIANNDISINSQHLYSLLPPVFLCSLWEKRDPAGEWQQVHVMKSSLSRCLTRSQKEAAFRNWWQKFYFLPLREALQYNLLISFLILTPFSLKARHGRPCAVCPISMKCVEQTKT